MRLQGLQVHFLLFDPLPIKYFLVICDIKTIQHLVLFLDDFSLRLNQVNATNFHLYNKIMSIAQIQIKSFQHLLARRQDVATANILPVGLPDAAVYYFVKEASFFGKKEERCTFFFFQGLNTNPQNLSIFLRDQAQREGRGSKQKLAKGVFAVFDLFSRSDVVIEINIPGNLRIYKVIGGKKQLVSNEEMDLMYLSSVLRAMYQINLPWGRHYLLFHDSKNYHEQLKAFFAIALKSLLNRDITISLEFQSSVRVKGSHACSLILAYIKDRRLMRHAVQILQELLQKQQSYRNCFKYRILLAQLYIQLGRTSKSLEQVYQLMQKHPKQPYLLYYQAYYLFEASLNDQALNIVNSIVQYNQFQTWILLARLHLQLKNFAEMLVCLNHAVRFVKIKTIKSIEGAFKVFEDLGKAKNCGSLDSMENSPKLLIYTDSPLNILVKEVEEKNKFLVESGYWKLNPNQKLVYNLVKQVRYRLESKRFEQLLLNTFDDNIPKPEPFSIRKGISLPSSNEDIAHKITQQPVSFRKGSQEEQELPQFLKNSVDKVDESMSVKPSRNLSIIPQIQSVIENSNYEEKEKQKSGRGIRLKRQVQQGLFKVVQMVLGEGDFEKAEYENNVAKILPIYNKMRTSSKHNSYFADKMFKLFMQVANYRSIIVLIAQTLDFLEQRGVRRVDKLPYWMHKYLFFIIEEKGLKFLNQMLKNLNFYDEAIIDTIEIAKSWKMKGVAY